MISGIKICGVSDIKTLNYIINHPSPPQYVGFITNYKKSKRYVNYETLKQDLDDPSPEFINNLIDDTEKKIKSEILSDKENYLLSHKLEVLKTFN